jgi:hypothetical protein
MTKATSQGYKRHSTANAATDIQRVTLNQIPNNAAAIKAAVMDASSNLAFLELEGLALIRYLPHGFQCHLFKGGAGDRFVMSAVFCIDTHQAQMLERGQDKSTSVDASPCMQFAHRPGYQDSVGLHHCINR